VLEIDINWIDSKYPGLLAVAKEFILGQEPMSPEPVIILKSEGIRVVVPFLISSGERPMTTMVDLFAFDYLKSKLDMPERFAVVYQFANLMENRRIFLKVYLDEDKPEVDSIHDLVRAANWFEREAWDLYGVVFRGHPNLVRILCHQDFEGHPLRKDYPANQFQRLKSSTSSQGL